MKKGLGGTWWMRCAWYQSIEVSDHAIIVAEVVAAGTYADWKGQPGLIYAEGKYRSVGDIVQVDSSRPAQV